MSTRTRPTSPPGFCRTTSVSANLCVAVSACHAFAPERAREGRHRRGGSSSDRWCRRGSRSESSGSAGATSRRSSTAAATSAASSLAVCACSAAAAAVSCACCACCAWASTASASSATLSSTASTSSTATDRAADSTVGCEQCLPEDEEEQQQRRRDERRPSASHLGTTRVLHEGPAQDDRNDAARVAVGGSIVRGGAADGCADTSIWNGWDFGCPNQIRSTGLTFSREKVAEPGLGLETSGGQVECERLSGIGSGDTNREGHVATVVGREVEPSPQAPVPGRWLQLGGEIGELADDHGPFGDGGSLGILVWRSS